MSYLDYALPLIKHFEGCRLTGYLDSVGIPTVGWGTTGPDVTEGMCVTQQWADDRLEQRVIELEGQIDRRLGDAVVADNIMGALVSFAYNLGINALLGSTLWKKLLAGDTTGAAAQFSLWDHAGGKVLLGLTHRRYAEAQCFLSGVLP